MIRHIASAFSQDASEEIRFELTELKGRRLLDIRVYAEIRAGEDKIPTGKGVTIPVARFKDLKDSVLKTEIILKEKNWFHE